MVTSANAHWYLLSLRPVGAHAGLRAAVVRAGGRLVALSPWRIDHDHSADAGHALRAALTAPATLFTSPASAMAAQALDPDFAGRLNGVIAVGEGTARALRRRGVRDVVVPPRMDSEGLLALPQLAISGTAIGLVTAPGGRGMIAEALSRRGIAVLRADIYRRVPITLSAQALARLAACVDRSVLALSSGEALQRLLPQLPVDLLAALRQRPLVAASDRLTELGLTSGFASTHRAAGPMPAQLAAAALMITQKIHL